VSSLRVVIAEDNFLVREGVRRLLADGTDVVVLAEAASAPELMNHVKTLHPDAVLTDIRMPPGHGIEGIEAALEIRRDHPHTGVVVLSQHADASYARALFRHGTQGLGYLLKERVGDRGELVRALTAAATGGSVIDPRVVDELVGSERRVQDSRLRQLTARELEVLKEMAHGRTNGAIARGLFISESAVSKHITSIFAKLRLIEDASTDRRVTAVLTYVTNAGH
jgi:DNA-binding NarL/FixJ family response regulator